MFTPPKLEDLKGFSVAGLNDLYTVASAEHSTLVASIEPATASQEQIDQIKELQTFVASVVAELEDRQTRADELTAASTIPTLPVPATPVTPAEPAEVVTAAAGPEFAADGTKDVTGVTPAPVTQTESTVLEGTIVAAGAVTGETRRSVQPEDVAPYVPAPVVQTGNDA